MKKLLSLMNGKATDQCNGNSNRVKNGKNTEDI